MFFLVRTLLLLGLFVWALSTVDDITAAVKRQVAAIEERLQVR